MISGKIQVISQKLSLVQRFSPGGSTRDCSLISEPHDKIFILNVLFLTHVHTAVH